MDEDSFETPQGPMTRSRLRRPDPAAPRVGLRGRAGAFAVTPTGNAIAPLIRAPKKRRQLEEEMPSEVPDQGRLPTSTRLQIHIHKVHLTAEWKWKNVAHDDTCGICRSAFEACCVNCKVPGDDCPLVVGVCKHGFHQHCIVTWTDAQHNGRPQCPLCRQEWKVASSTIFSPPLNSPIGISGPIPMSNNS